jgi:DNA polymerase (family 10)
MDRFTQYEEVQEVLSRGTTKSTVLLRSGVQIDLRVVSEESFGSALHYFTGSKSHNITIRKLGIKKGLKINEYGVFRGNRKIAGRTEEEVYQAVNLCYIEPELREMRGEIEAAQKNRLPQLISLEDLRGDLHAHTDATDGQLTLEEVAEVGKRNGYEYVAVTDHSKHLTVAQGLTTQRLKEQIKKIDRLNGKLKGIFLLRAIEVDILEDGSLDLPDKVLAELDLTVCSIHSKFDLPEKKQTERIIRAMDHSRFNILGHPTGRLIGKRFPYKMSLEQVMSAAKDRGCFLEVNSQPDRMDLNDVYCKMAKDMGVRVSISTDAHSATDFDLMRFGISQARRGWLEPSDVINTLPWNKLKLLLKRD